MQKFINKNYNKLSVSISIDGTKIKHDLQRVDINGEGSYDTIMKNVPLWLTQFKGSTKVTFASKDLIYLKDSIIKLWEDGIEEVASNVVFENVWENNDDKILEDQLKQLADYVLENGLYNKYCCTFFDDTIGYYYNREDRERTFCGAGKMMALGPNGNIYPCLRYKDFSLNKQNEWIIGTVDEGITMEKVRPFVLATTEFQSDNECLNCQIASGCAFCQGFNYDESDEGTNFYRAKYICKMHKARVKANDYYFSKLYNKYGIEKEAPASHEKNKSYILLSDDFVSFCEYKNEIIESYVYMDDEILEKALDYARETFSDPIIVHSKTVVPKYIEVYENYHILHYIPIQMIEKINFNQFKDCRFIIEENNDSYKEHLKKHSFGNLKLIVNFDDCINLKEKVINLLSYSDDIEINMRNNRLDLNKYEQELLGVKEYLLDDLKKGNSKRVNLITDYKDDGLRNGCHAGERSFVIDPNGKVYPCCSNYFDDNNEIDNIQKRIKQPINRLLSLDASPLCSNCEIKGCHRCSYLNKKITNEYNIPSSLQCKKSVIEYNASVNYRNSVLGLNEIEQLEYNDPIEKWIKEYNALTGFYKIEE